MRLQICKFILLNAISIALVGCSAHKPRLTAAQTLLSKTPSLQSQAPTVRPEDVN